MKKNNQMSKKERQKKREKVITIAFLAVVILVLALALVQKLTQEETIQYVVTEEGHVHMANGTHVGTVEEIFGANGLVITEDGRILAADGTHVGDVDELDVGSEAEAQ